MFEQKRLCCQSTFSVPINNETSQHVPEIDVRILLSHDLMMFLAVVPLACEMLTERQQKVRTCYAIQFFGVGCSICRILLYIFPFFCPISVSLNGMWHSNPEEKQRWRKRMSDLYLGTCDFVFI